MLLTKKIFHDCLAFAIVCGVSINAYAKTEKIEKTFAVTPGGELIVDSTTGSIDVKTWGKKSVHVEVIKKSRKEANLMEFDVEIEKSGNTVSVDGGGRGWGSRVAVEYNISIPENFNVNLDTGGGEIRVADLTGKVKLDTSGGSITVGNVDGDVDADTSGGAINVGKVTGLIDVNTSGGGIRIAGGGKKVKADTSGGSINIGPSEGDVNADTSGGSITVGYAKGNVDVDTSGGSIDLKGSDGSVKVNTSGGSITIDNVAGTIDADTSGGGIEISRAHGAINADTSGGNIMVELLEDDPKVNTSINLDTSGGSITVHLPEKLQASISAKLQLSRWSSHDAQIYSDFPLTIKEENNRIVGAGDINGGGDRVILNSSNGDIHIKKLK